VRDGSAGAVDAFGVGPVPRPTEPRSASAEGDPQVNVVYYLDRFPKLSQSFILNEIYELTQRGHRVAVFSATEPDERLRHDEYAELDVPVYYAPAPSVSQVATVVTSGDFDPRAVLGTLALIDPKQYAGALYLAHHATAFVESLPFEPDLIHGHFLNWPKLGAVYTGSRLDLPVTMTAHAYDLFEEPSHALLGTVLDNLTRVVTISEYNDEYLHRTFEPVTPVEVVHAGVRPEKYRSTGESVEGRLLSVARFVEKKGLAYAIDAVARLRERRPRIEYHIVGTGEREASLRRRARKRGVEDVVTFLGSVSDERLVAEFDEAQVFVLPCVVASNGDRDGIPVALMELMAMETPPVSTTVSGIPELVSHGANGLLVSPRDVAGLTDAVERLLCDDELRHRLGRTARQTVESEFNVHNEVESLLTVFERAVAEHGVEEYG